MANDEKDRKESSASEKPFWAEAVKDLTMTGLAGLFASEDMIKNYIKERKFPKDMAANFVDGLQKKKDDFYTAFSKEVGQVIGKIDFTKEFTKFLENHEIEIDAKVSFKPKNKENS